MRTSHKLGLGGLAMLASSTLLAADHVESPAAIADRPADIADVFFFAAPDNANRLVGIITYGGGSAVSDQNDAGFYCDRDVLYSFFVDRDDDSDPMTVAPDVRMNIRMAPQADGSCDVRLEGVPGAGASFEGSVAGTSRSFQSSNGLNAFVGSTDDPFFFDFQGFADTLATGTLAFDNTRDAFANRNLSAIAFQIDTLALSPSGSVFKAWATTARFVE